jgi:NMD protein affecting ribosome stability and mRNA decay
MGTYVCIKCGAHCDAGELVGGICEECRSQEMENIQED